MAGRLEGRVFVVTGSTQGLGEAVARQLASEGARGIVICGRNEEKGAAVATSLTSASTRAVYVPVDLENEADCRNVIQKCKEEFGCIHGLVNSAASTARGTIEDTSAELWDQMFRINVRAPFILMQEAIRLMKESKNPGSIVNISSVSSYGGQPFLTAYCSSKGALNTLTKNTAFSLRPDRIRVNSLNLGWMATPAEDSIQRSVHNRPENWLEIEETKQPLGRILRPNEVAKMVCYLLSDDAEMVTGSLIDFGVQDPVGASF
eukprot:GILK01006836.1.p1 GENE.GILK01006836.1~~GILK01006836.1.p1  ORF type:complete len:262 (-),score=49.23 GILK01006836.1:206-991(-)